MSPRQLAFTGQSPGEERVTQRESSGDQQRAPLESLSTDQCMYIKKLSKADRKSKKHLKGAAGTFNQSSSKGGSCSHSQKPD